MILTKCGVTDHASKLGVSDRVKLRSLRKRHQQRAQDRVVVLKFGESRIGPSRFLLPQKGASVQKRGTQYWSYVLNLCADTLRKRFELDELKTALAKVQSERSQTEHILSTVERVRLRSSQSLRKKAYALLSNELWKESIILPNMLNTTSILDHLPAVGNGNPRVHRRLNEDELNPTTQFAHWHGGQLASRPHSYRRPPLSWQKGVSGWSNNTIITDTHTSGDYKQYPAVDQSSVLKTATEGCVGVSALVSCFSAPQDSGPLESSRPSGSGVSKLLKQGRSAAMPSRSLRLRRMSNSALITGAAQPTMPPSSGAASGTVDEDDTCDLRSEAR